MNIVIYQCVKNIVIYQCVIGDDDTFMSFVIYQGVNNFIVLVQCFTV